MSEHDAVRRTRTPGTVAVLGHDLVALGVKPGDILLVHSSLSALGWVCGGPGAVVDALRTAVGPAGTVVMPSFSAQMTDPVYWENPPVPEAWVETIREETPPYDRALTPTRKMGAIVEYFRRLPAARRSSHPHVSFVAAGPRAGEITANHGLAYGLGETSPLARLYDLEARVLLLGVGFEACSAFHLAEHRAKWRGKREYTEGAPIWREGKREWVEFTELATDSDDFARLGAAFAPRTKSGTVGAGEARLFPLRTAVDFAALWLPVNR
jgi:aminoglycoside 3-N-acetyltransferase